MRHVIINGNSLSCIKKINEEIHLVITSPPYFNAKEYNKEHENIGNNESYSDYLRKIRQIIKEIYEKLVPGGFVCWNTSPVIQDKKRYGIPFDTHKVFEEEGFEFQEDIVWVKPDGAAKLRCGGWIQNEGRPTTWHPNIVTEYIMVYKKPGTREQKEFKPFNKYYLSRPKDLITNVWYMNPETNKHKHDAPFPEELVRRLVLLYSYLGDVVLDPFAGTLTVTKVCEKLERNSISIEISRDYIEYGKTFLNFNQTTLVDVQSRPEIIELTEDELGGDINGQRTN